MKSGILCAVFALCGSVCFGQWSLEVTGGMPASSAFFDDEYSVEHGYSAGISKRFYLLGRVQGGFDFVSYSTSTAKGAGGVITKHDFAFGRSFSVNPQLGIGIQF
jgi:hypothetical protein